MSNSLAAALASTLFSAADVVCVLAQDNHADRTKLLEAVRAESDARFLSALRAIFREVPWADKPTVLHPLLSLLGPACIDHLRAVDLLRFAEQTDLVDADFALDVVRAIEFDDDAAVERVRARLAVKTIPSTLAARPPVAFPLPSDPVGGLRAANVVRRFLGETDEQQLRAAVVAGIGQGNYVAHLAGAIAVARGMAMPEDVNELQDARRLGGRMLIWTAWSIDPAFGEEMLSLVVEGDWWDTADIEAYALPWDRTVEKVSAGKHAVTRLIGATVLKGSAPFDSFAGPPPKKVVKWRISAKRYADVKKATKELDKAAVAAGDAPTYAQGDLDQRLHFAVNSGRERVAELLRRGAHPNGYSDVSDPYWKGYTTLHRAAGSADCAELVRQLLAAGADPTAEWQGGTAIDGLHGSQEASSLAADRLAATGCRSTRPAKLFEAAEHGYHRFAAALVRAGADPAATHDGKTALETALAHKHLRTAVALGYRP